MHRIALLTTLSCCLAAHAAMAAPAYAVSRTVPLGAPDRWDYLSFDAPTHRVFVAHGDHTDVVDAADGRVLGRLAGLHGAHGQAVAASGEIYADSRQTAQVTAFDPHGFAAVTTLPAGAGADAMIYEPVHKLAVVLDGDGQSATLVDTATHTVRSTVSLGGNPEFGVADGAGRLYINIASTAEIAQLDAATGRITARLAAPGCQSPHGLAMDTATRRLFVTCENATMIVVDADGGRLLQSLPIGHGSDAAAFDPVHHRVFSSNYDATLSVFHEAADGSLAPLDTVPTALGARTMTLDPSTGRVFLVTADPDPAHPPTQSPHGLRYNWLPGSVHLLILDPASK